MRRYILSLLVSITVPIITSVGQIFAIIFFHLAISIQTAFINLIHGNIAAYLFGLEIISIVGSGIIGGFISGHVCIKLYRNIHFVTAMLIPTAFFGLMVFISIFFTYLEGFASGRLIMGIAAVMALITYADIIRKHVKATSALVKTTDAE